MILLYKMSFYCNKMSINKIVKETMFVMHFFHDNFYGVDFLTIFSTFFGCWEYKQYVDTAVYDVILTLHRIKSWKDQLCLGKLRNLYWWKLFILSFI